MIALSCDLQHDAASMLLPQSRLQWLLSKPTTIPQGGSVGLLHILLDVGIMVLQDYFRSDVVGY